MNFLNPFYLIGLAAAAIPILIHLLNLRKNQKIEFSTLFFLKEMQKTKLRNIKIKKWLLLLIRVLIITCVVLAFSRPIIKSIIPGFSIGARKSHIILIDNSYSMDYKDENGNRLNQAKNLALNILKSVSDGEEVCVMPLQSKSKPFFSRDLDKIEEEVKQIKLGNYRDRFTRNLDEAVKMTTVATNQNKVIYLISDMPEDFFPQTKFDAQGSGDKTSDKTILVEQEDREILNIDKYTGLVFFPIKSSNEDIKNLSLGKTHFNSGSLQVGGDFNIEIQVNNYSKDAVKAGTLNLYLNNERVAQRQFDVEGHKSQVVSIGTTIKQGGEQNIKLEIENDALDFDNYKYISFIVPEKAKVLLYGAKIQKMKYLLLALGSNPDYYKNVNLKQLISEKNAGVDKLSDYFNLTVVDDETFDYTSLEDFDVIIMEGPTNARNISKIEEKVRNGGKLIQFADNTPYTNADFLSYRDVPSMQILVDANVPLLERTDKSYSYINTFLDNPGEITKFNKEHPIFKGLFKEDIGQRLQLESPLIKHLIPVNSSVTTQDYEDIISVGMFSFLSETKYGKGKILFYTVSVEDEKTNLGFLEHKIEWSNFQYTSLFPALLYRSISYLANEDLNLTISDRPQAEITINTKKQRVTKLKIMSPDSTFSFPTYRSGNGDDIIVNIKDLDTPGIYTIMNEDNVVSTFAINVDSKESNFNGKFDEQVVKNYLNSYYKGNNSAIQIINNTDKLTDKMLKVSLGSELWKFFVILTLLLVILEMLVQKYYGKQDADNRV